MGNFLNLLISNFETPALIILSLIVVFVFFYLRKDIKAIKEDLHNHVTDTDKKIDKLDVKIDTKINQLDVKIDQLRTDMYAKFDQLNDKTDTKIEQLRADIYTKFDKTDAKLDSNFNHINLRLDQAFHRPQKENDV